MLTTLSPDGFQTASPCWCTADLSGKQVSNVLDKPRPHLDLSKKSSRSLLVAISSFSLSLSRLHLLMYFLSARTASPLWQPLPSSVVIAYMQPSAAGAGWGLAV